MGISYEIHDRNDRQKRDMKKNYDDGLFHWSLEKARNWARHQEVDKIEKGKESFESQES